MSWEQRRGQSYYYRKVREGERVRSEYMGTGLLAQLCADYDAANRRDQAHKLATTRAARHAEAQIDRQLASAESSIVEMTRAALFAAGYHQHKGQWRKKRHEK